MQALENSKIKGRAMDGSSDPVEQDAGGWIFMPQDHWEAIKRTLESKDKSELQF